MELRELSFLCAILLIYTAECHVAGGCDAADHARCVSVADPLISDPHLIFPDNMMDIDRVCRTWSKFVDCIKSYIDRCFTESRRQAFNQAVEIPVDSVHQMCTSTQYQTEYLQHATCLKRTLIEERHCGRHYRMLATQAQSTGAGSTANSRDVLCCSHNRFRECVLTETRRVCDPHVTPASKMLASAFSKQVLDKALSFLREQCAAYRPEPGECLMTSLPSNDEGDVPVLQPTVDPMTWIPSSRDGRRRTSSTLTTTTSTPSTTTTTSASTLSSSWMNGGNTLFEVDPQQQNIARSSYGRGVTWSNQELSSSVMRPTGNTKVVDNDDNSIFKVTHYKPSTEAWYPAAASAASGNVFEHFNAIDVDEPNQQGLSHFAEGAGSTTNPFTTSLVAVLLYFIICVLP